MDLKSKQRNQRYKKKHIKFKQYTLGVGEKGFLCSCNNREKECIRECYVILNKYFDQLYKSETEGMKSSDDIDDDLKSEIAGLKSIESKSKRFQVLESGAKNFLFIRATIDDPVELAVSILKDIHESQQLQSRHLIRLIPVETTCKAYISNITKSCSELLEKHFKDSARTFSIIFNHRNNNSLSRDKVIEEIADLVYKIRSDHVVNLNNAEISIVIEVVRGIALLAIIPDYLKYKKFNLHAISSLNTNMPEKSKDGIKTNLPEKSEDDKEVDNK